MLPIYPHSHTISRSHTAPETLDPLIFLFWRLGHTWVRRLQDHACRTRNFELLLQISICRCWKNSKNSSIMFVNYHFRVLLFNRVFESLTLPLLLLSLDVGACSDIFSTVTSYHTHNTVLCSCLCFYESYVLLNPCYMPWFQSMLKSFKSYANVKYWITSKWQSLLNHF